MNSSRRLFGLVAPLWLSCAASAGTSCEDLKSLSFPNTAISDARSIAAGPDRGIDNLPARCQVAAILTPSPDSHIEMQLWLPTSGWNGKFEGVGNGGWAGTINYSGMAAALAEGYATGSTDTGHKSSETPGGAFAPGHPEKLKDFGSRAVHEMTAVSRKFITAFYGSEPRLSYWNSCSNGGRQGLMEAQRFPEDYDGIVAGSPAADWTGRALASLWVAQAVHKSESGYIPPNKYPLIHSAVLRTCDQADGLADGILENPVECKFDPNVLLCPGSDEVWCLTAAQVEAARRIYAPAADAVSKREFYPGLEPGSELGWATFAGPKPFSIGADYGKFVMFSNPAWDYRSFNFATDAGLAEHIDNGTINAKDPDLGAFFSHGGKLIQYHGWSDPQIPPMHSVNYYKSVLNAMGGAGKVQSSYRLFMVPGMQHCGGGPGPNQFNSMAALERWRESDVAPDSIVASHVANNRIDMTRPLCPYPMTAHYKGAGSAKDAGNFVCRPPSP
jgi:feruloyl esterase